jgi:aspartate aminotransferase
MPLADAARRRGITVHHLNIGQPDLPTPEPMLAALRDFREEVLAYGPAEGLPACRAAWRRYYAGAGFEIADPEILVTTAGSEAILFALAAATNPGDRVLIPEPLLGIEVTPVPCAVEDGYHLPADLEAQVDSRTRAILYANPGNPTGTVYRKDELQRLAALAVDRDLFLIADEVYREFVYSAPGDANGVVRPGRALSVLELPGLEEQAIVVDSLSKRFSLCGARVGAIVSRNPELMSAVKRFAMARLSPPVLGQIVAAAANEVDPEYFAAIRTTYRARRDLTVAALPKAPSM